MNDTPLVTIIIPTHNRANLLMEAIASVTAQSYPRWEIIVVDDGSTDDTLMRLIGLGDPRIRVVGSEHIGHLGRLHNLGAQMSRGEYLAFLEPGDQWLPEKLAQQVRAVAASGAGWSYTSYTIIDDNGANMSLRSSNGRARSDNVIANLLCGKIDVCLSSLLVSRALYFVIGGFVESAQIPDCGDIDIVLRLARRAEAIALPQVLTRVHEHRGRMTANVGDADEHTAMVYRLFLQREEDPALVRLARRRLGQCLADAGAQHIAHGNLRQALASFGKSLTASGPQIHQIRAAGRGLRNLAKIGNAPAPPGQSAAHH